MSDDRFVVFGLIGIVTVLITLGALDMENHYAKMMIDLAIVASNGEAVAFFTPLREASMTVTLVFTGVTALSWGICLHDYLAGGGAWTTTV